MDFKALFLQLVSVFGKLTKQQKIIIASAVVGIVGFLIFLVVYTSKSSDSNKFETLFDSLSSEDASKVIEQLEKDKIPYEIHGNNTIKVPKNVLYKERISIASMGIPKHSGVGFELFDKQEFGSTAFDQNIKYLRAIEGELSRTIQALDPIESATVSLALPKETLFVEKKTKPSASVMIRLKESKSLTPKQIRGIKNLVASAVANLETQNVMLVDSDGETLGDEDEMAQASELSIVQQQYKTKEERKLQRKIIEVISPFVGGEDKVVAQVTMEFDFSQQNTTSEKFDPENVVRSEQSTEEKREGAKPTEVGGVPGTISNIGPVENLGSNESKEKYEKNSATTNYEVSKTISTTKSEFARIKRLTAAVVVDGKYKHKLDDKGNPTDELEYEALSDSDLDALLALVGRSIGASDQRGDQVSVKNLPFKSPNLDTSEAKVAKALNFSKTYLEPFSEALKYIAVFVILLVLYKKVISPFAEKMLEVSKEEEEQVKPKLILDTDLEDEDLVEKAQNMRKKVEEQLGVGDGFNEDELKYEVILEKIKSMVDESPESVAQLLQTLLAEDGSLNLK